MPQEFEMSWVSMPRWTPPAHLEDADPARRGRLETHKLTSKPLEADVEFQVYVPAGYDAGEQRYPVVYVLDRAATSERARYPQALDNLIGTKCRPLIAVFVDPAPFMKNQQYGQMLAMELLPYVDQHYRTIASPEGRAFQGTGFAAGDALFAAAGEHAVARKVACQSPFVFDGMIGPLVGMFMGMPGDKPVIYLDWGKYDLRSTHENWNTADRTRALAEKLQAAGCTIRGGEANDGCDWPSWRNRTDDILVTLFPLEGGE
jgi:enterochelin esterase-like enzyme